MPVASGQDTLDPRQEKAREEFQKMREQLRRTLERTIEPAPWREQATAPEAPQQQRLPAPRSPQPALVAHPPASKWIEVISIAGASFVMGAIVTLAAVGMGHKEPAAAPGPVAATPPAGAAHAAIVHAVTPPGAAQASEPASVREASITRPAAAVAAPLSLEPSSAEPASPAPVVAALERAAEPAAPARPTPTPAAVQPPAAVKQEAALGAKPEAAKQEAAPPSVKPEPAPEVKPEPVAAAETGQIKEMQVLLKGLGYPPGPLNGLPGAKTLKAADAFAKRYGLQDSDLDAAFLAALRKADSGKLVPPAQDADGNEPVADRVQRIRDIQTLLNTLGHPIGKPNGLDGPKTKEASAAFAAEQGLADSNPDAAFLAFLQEKAAAPH